MNAGAGSAVRTSARAVRTSAGAPPWLWFYLALFLTSVGDYYSLIRWQLSDTGSDLSSVFGTVLQLLPLVVLLLGLLSSFFPWLRRASVERKFQLSDPPGDFPLMPEIMAFLQQHAPGLQVKVNLVRAGQSAFTYPAGYLHGRLALFGGFFKLWSTDRKAAQAILLHEIAHYRLGDAQILGVGSLFEPFVKYGAFLAAVLLALPFVNTLTSQWLGLSFASEMFLRYLLPLIVFGLAYYLVMYLEYLWLPLTGIWLAEINADRYVSERLGTAEPVQAALAQRTMREPWWRGPLGMLTHPPARVRRWLVGQEQHISLFVLIMLFPLAYATRPLLQFVELIIPRVALGEPLGDILPRFLAQLAGRAPVFLAMAALLVVWPFVRPLWERLFGKDQSRVDTSHYLTYVLGSAVLILISFAMRSLA